MSHRELVTIPRHQSCGHLFWSLGGAPSTHLSIFPVSPFRETSLTAHQTVQRYQLSSAPNTPRDARLITATASYGTPRSTVIPFILDQTSRPPLDS